jgi:hypothetical protein
VKDGKMKNEGRSKRAKEEDGMMERKELLDQVQLSSSYTLFTTFLGFSS